MMKKVAVAALLLGSACSAWAGNAESGAQLVKANQCAGCHGPKGVSVMPNVPNLAGRPAAELEAALNRYRNGELNNPMMTPNAEKLSDQDAADLAAYYATL